MPCPTAPVRRIVPCLLVALLALSAVGDPARAGETQPAPATVTGDAQTDRWVVLYEQAFGFDGLYVYEAPAVDGDEARRVREELRRLSSAARQLLRDSPGATVSVDLLRARGLIDDPPRPPEGAQYAYFPELGRFLCSLGGEYDLVAGATGLMRGAERFRHLVLHGSPALVDRWQRLRDDPDAPAQVRREAEARLFVFETAHDEDLETFIEIHRLLGQLNDAIELAIAARYLEPGASITMNDVGATGLIDRLRALPDGAEYVVTTAGSPPAARWRGALTNYSPQAVHERQAERARRLVQAQPDYPPAIAYFARFNEGDRALELLDMAIEQWPDVPALRVQRLGALARLGRPVEFTRDAEFLIQNFPAAPILMEMVQATRQGPFGDNAELRARIAEAAAVVRPEVLPLQLVAIRDLQAAGEFGRARTLREALLDRNPGFAPFVQVDGGGQEPSASESNSSSDTTPAGRE